MTPGGKQCTSAKSPFKGMKYHPRSEYDSKLDECNLECLRGLHFYTSQRVKEEKSNMHIGEECDAYLDKKVGWF